jgi:hypothetical protein
MTIYGMAFRPKTTGIPLMYLQATKRNKMKNHAFLFASIFLLALVFPGCNNSEQRPAAPSNFTAEISGSITGQVSGSGVVTFLPPTDTGAGPRPGYFFIADATGVRDFGITFTIPIGTKPGKYQLVSAHPMDAGKEFEVRVDRSIGNRTESFQKNTAGTITLEHFPEDGSNITGTYVRGDFEFTTERKGGERVKAKGTFDFKGR